MKTLKAIVFIALIFIWGCSQENIQQSASKQLTIFFVNDVHGQIDNFAKLKQMVDAERADKNVLLLSSGDMFSGNPVVDNFNDKGFPIIDLMNDCGFDLSAIGNHEFDYGQDVLQKRIQQSDFPWVCANINTQNSVLSQPEAFHTIEVGDLRITFLGLIETAGSPSEVFPSSHPWKVKNLEFTPAQNMVKNYLNLKKQENADLLIALSHLGLSSYENSIGDFQLAYENYFFDAIIGGHTHALMDTVFSGIPIYQAGSYLNYVGKITFDIRDKTITSEKFEIFLLDDYQQVDPSIQTKIDEYNDLPYLKEVIGFANIFHARSQVGCFYTDALRQQMKVDVAFQNTGGVRSVLDYGDITVREIYEISPFNNGTVIYEMTVAQIKEFLIGSESGYYYSGLRFYKSDGELVVADMLNRKIPDDYVLKVGINDYIPAVFPHFFSEKGQVQQLSAAETLIAFLRSSSENVDYSSCNQYFKF